MMEIFLEISEDEEEGLEALDQEPWQAYAIFKTNFEARITVV